MTEFEIRPNLTTFIERLKLMYKVVNTLAPLSLIGYSSFLQVTRTTIISRTSSKFGQIGSRTAVLAAIEHLKIPINL